MVRDTSSCKLTVNSKKVEHPYPHTLNGYTKGNPCSDHPSTMFHLSAFGSFSVGLAPTGLLSLRRSGGSLCLRSLPRSAEISAAG